MPERFSFVREVGILVVGFLLLAWGFICGADSMRQYMQRQAYQAGAGDWVLNPDGKLEWHWIGERR
jgi:hypothetical protein